MLKIQNYRCTELEQTLKRLQCIKNKSFRQAYNHFHLCISSDLDRTGLRGIWEQNKEIEMRPIGIVNFNIMWVLRRRQGSGMIRHLVFVDLLFVCLFFALGSIFLRSKCFPEYNRCVCLPFLHNIITNRTETFNGWLHWTK